jgi:hypothetical protein
MIIATAVNIFALDSLEWLFVTIQAQKEAVIPQESFFISSTVIMRKKIPPCGMTCEGGLNSYVIFLFLSLSSVQ